MKYPSLGTLIQAYLSQDFEHDAETAEGVVDVYRKQATADHVARLRADIAAFLAQERSALDEAFDVAFGFDFDPRAWGMTAESFLRMLDDRLQR
jgi:hypothetical protein